MAAMNHQNVRVVVYLSEQVWHFPYDRFVEHEAKDEAWARPLGFGRLIGRTETFEVTNAIVEINRPVDSIYSHVNITPCGSSQGTHLCSY